MLVINDLSKKFGDFQVLDNISINAEKSQIYGLVGSNGCGKTTILKHIMKIYKHDEGYIAFDGEEVEEDSEIIKDFYYVQDSLFFPYQYTLNKLFNYEKLMYKNMSREKFEYLLNYFPNAEGSIEFQYEELGIGDTTYRLLIYKGQIIKEEDVEAWCYGYGNLYRRR